MPLLHRLVAVSINVSFICENLMGSFSAGPLPPLPNEQRLPGARTALVLLLSINLFNYVDRQVLAAVESKIQHSYFVEGADPRSDPVVRGLDWLLHFWIEDNADQAAKDRSLTEFAMGSLNMAFMVSYFVLAPLFGWLADRTRRWALVGFGVLLWSLASGGSGFAPTFAILFFTRCLVGVGEAAYGPVAPTVISDLYPVSQRSTKLAWFYLAIPVGSACGYILGGQMATIMNDWRWAFYVVVPPGIILGVWCFLMKEPQRGQSETPIPPAPLPGPIAEAVMAGEPPPASAGPTIRKVGFKDYLVLLRTPSYVLNTLGMTAMTFALGGIGFWMPRYVSLERGAGDLAHVTLVFGVILVVSGLGATLLGGLAGDWLKPRFPGSYFLVSALGMLLGFPLFLATLYVPFPLAWVFIFLACFSLFFNTGPTNTILANVTHPSIRATAFALNIFIIHALGDAVSPMILGAINGYAGNMNVGFFIVSLMFLVSAACWFAGSFYLAKDTELAPRRLG